MTGLGRLAVLAIVASLGAPAGAAFYSSHKPSAPVAPSSRTDAAAVRGALLAVRQRLSGLRKKAIASSAARAAKHQVAVVAVSQSSAPQLREEQAEIDALRAKLAALQSVPVPRRRTAPPAWLFAPSGSILRRRLSPTASHVAAPGTLLSGSILPQQQTLPDPPVKRKEVIGLPALELLVGQAPEMRLALSSAQVSSARIAALRSQRGPELTLMTSAGAYRELVTDTLVRDYTGADLRLGIRVPLFRKSSQGAAASELGDELVARQFDVDEARLTVLRDLRERYVDYWTSTRKSALTNAYLRSEPEVSSAVALRVRSGLTLRGDGLQALSGYDIAKENAARFASDASTSLDQMRRLTDRELSDFEPVEPVLTAGCQTQAQFVQAALATSPGLTLLRQQLDESRRLAGRPGSALQGSMTVSQGVVAQQGAPTAGRSTSVQLDLALPVDSGGVAAERRLNAARADEVAARLKYETEQLRIQADALWDGMREADVEVHIAQSRVDTSRELTREGLLRYGSLAGNTVENLQTGRLAYYRSLLDELDAESQLAKRRIVAIGPAGGCARGATASRDEAVSSSGAHPATDSVLRMYAWNSRELLAADWTQAAFWDRFTSQGIRRLMLSLDSGQIRDAQAKRGQFQDRLQRFIATGASAGVSIDLLLGEPHWILADHRSGLISILQSLRDVPFDALELDIEPSQIAAETRRSAHDLQGDLLETIRAVAAVSPWPVSLSANYRDLTRDPAEAGRCYACALQSSGVKEIVLMTYVANPDRVAELVRPILRSAPTVSFAVAQSVEASLPSGESYRMDTRPEFANSMLRLTRLLDSEPNFSGIAVQSYLDYTAMRP